MSDQTGSENDQNDIGQGDTGDDTQGTSSGSQQTTGSQQDNTQGTNDVVTRDEYEKIVARMKAADQRASKLEAEREEAARKERSELENTQKDLELAQKRIAELEELVNSTAMETAFVKYGKHDWVDVDAALRLLDREGVDVKDGKVSGLEKAIEQLVKAKPYLVKKSDQNDSSGASGSASNGRRKGEGDGVKPDFSSRFPALRRPAAQK